MSRTQANSTIEKKEPLKLFENFRQKRNNIDSKVESTMTETKPIDNSESVSVA